MRVWEKEPGAYSIIYRIFERRTFMTFRNMLFSDLKGGWIFFAWIFRYKTTKVYGCTMGSEASVADLLSFLIYLSE